jgi:hypothetical protein
MEWLLPPAFSPVLPRLPVEQFTTLFLHQHISSCIVVVVAVVVVVCSKLYHQMSVIPHGCWYICSSILDSVGHALLQTTVTVVDFVVDGVVLA